MDIKRSQCHRKWQIVPYSQRVLSWHQDNWPWVSPFKNLIWLLFCSQTCRMKSVVGSSFFKCWLRYPLGLGVAGLLSGPVGDVRGQEDCWAESPSFTACCSRLCDPQHRVHGFEQGHQRELCVCRCAFNSCLCVINKEQAGQLVHAVSVSSLINLYVA